MVRVRRLRPDCECRLQIGRKEASPSLHEQFHSQPWKIYANHLLATPHANATGKEPGLSITNSQDYPISLGQEAANMLDAGSGVDGNPKGGLNGRKMGGSFSSNSWNENGVLILTAMWKI